MPEGWKGIIPTEIFVDEGKRLVEEATKRGVPIRLLGGVAIRVHCAEYLDFANRLQRLGEGQQEYTDLDFMSYGKYRNKMKEFFNEMGYEKRPTTMSSAATQRQIYFHPKGWFTVDTFFDKLLAANHPLDFKNRLELDTPTVTPTDLLLEKLQIVFPSEKDIKDATLMLHAHEISQGEENNRINAKFVSELFASDWGFWYSATTNLNGLKGYMTELELINEAEKKDVTVKIDAMLSTIENTPKSSGWKMRSMMGTKKKWYNPVETTQTVGEFGLWRLREKKPQAKS